MDCRSLSGFSLVTSRSSMKDPAVGRFDQPVDHLEGRRLTATRWADEGDDMARLDVEVEVSHGGLVLPPESFLDAVESDGGTGHRCPGCATGPGGRRVGYVGHDSPLEMVKRPRRTSRASKTRAIKTMRMVPVSAIWSALAPPRRDNPLKINDPRPGPRT